MRNFKKVLVVLSPILICGAAPPKLSRYILESGQAYANLKELTDKGSRLSGSPGAAQAVE